MGYGARRMRAARSGLALAAASSLLAVISATAGAAGLPAIPQQFKAKVEGTAKFEWDSRRGPVGTRCQDWNSQEGMVRQKFATRNAGLITLLPGRIAGQGVGPATITGSIDSTVASSLEPGCPALCPGATVARAGAVRGPLASVADCAQTATPRVEASTSCKAAAPKPVSLFIFRGTSTLAMDVALSAEVPTPADKRCVVLGTGFPRLAKLFKASAMRKLGAGGVLRKVRTLTGVCPGTTRTGPELTALGPFKCSYVMKVSVTVSRL